MLFRIPRRKNSLYRSGGYTIIETLVAIAIFAVVMTVAIGALVSVIDANRKARAQKLVIDNLTIAIESMTRSIREGSTYHCGSGGTITDVQLCPGGSSFLALEPYGGSPYVNSDQTVFRLSGEGIERSTDGGTSYVGMTSPDITIEDLTFYTVSYGAAGETPKVLVTITGHYEADGKTSAEFFVQTTISEQSAVTTVSTPDGDATVTTQEF